MVNNTYNYTTKLWLVVILTDAGIVVISGPKNSNIKKMKVFQAIQRHYAALGIISAPNQPNQKYSFNKRILFALGCLDISFCHNLCTFFAWPVVWWSTWCALVRPLQVLFNLFALRPLSIENQHYSKASKKPKNSLIQVRAFSERFECKIEMFIFSLGCKYPQSEEFFMKTNRQVDRLTELIFIVLVKIGLQCIMLSKAVVCFGIYFTTDSGSDSFDLPFPMWWITNLSWKF